MYRETISYLISMVIITSNSANRIKRKMCIKNYTKNMRNITVPTDLRNEWTDKTAHSGAI